MGPPLGGVEMAHLSAAQRLGPHPLWAVAGWAKSRARISETVSMDRSSKRCATAGTRSDQTHTGPSYCGKLAGPFPQVGEGDRTAIAGQDPGTDGETFMAYTPSLEIPKKQRSALA